MDNRPIGIFDSGVGGLTILSSLKKRLPHETFLYIADHAHLPYGDKTVEQLEMFSSKIIDYFVSQDVKLVLIHCNTASAVAIDYLRSRYNVPIIGVIVPTIDAFIKDDKDNVLVIATETTIKNKVYQDILHKLLPHLSIQAVATQKFVEMIESDNYESFETVCDQYFSHLEPFDNMILGCTHFPFIQDRLDHYFKHQVKFYDSVVPMTETVLQFLETHTLFANQCIVEPVRIMTTGDSCALLDIAKPLLQFDYAFSCIEL